MKAAIYDRYGGPEVIAVRDVPKPVPKDREVLVRVHAASVNSWDWDNLRGRHPRSLGMTRLRQPHIPGSDIAGIVEAAGPLATRFKPGDAVFGDITTAGFGAFAEYAAADEELLVRKPDAIGFVEAAAIPQAGVLALQGLRKRPLRPGETALINGAGGGVGTFAVQLAKLAGAEVTGVDAGAKLDLVRSLGADHVVDYAREDFTAAGRRYDLILDVVACRSMLDYARALNRGGRLVVIGGHMGRIAETAFLGSWVSRLRRKRMGLLLWRPSALDLEQLAALVVAGRLRPVIDTIYPLDAAAEAVRHIGEGRTLGKVVVAVRK